MEIGTKRCKECGQILPLSEFNVNSKMKDGHLNICKKCKYEQKKKRIAARKENTPSLETSRPQITTSIEYEGIHNNELIRQCRAIIKELRARGFGFNENGKLTYLHEISLI